MMNANIKDINELQGAYIVDGAHSSLEFSVRHLITDTKGNISIDSGVVNLQNTQGAKIYIRLDMTTLNTQNTYRDDHLRNKEEFFEVTKHKYAVFEATEVTRDSATDAEYHYIAKGKLTMKGITKDMDLYFNYIRTEIQDQGDHGKNNVAGFEGRGIINRGEFNIGTGMSIGENVKIVISLEAAQRIK